MKISHRHR